MSGDQHPFDRDLDWEALQWDWVPEDEEAPAEPRWRRSVIVAVATLVVVAMALVPLSNVLRGPPTADNGLEVCGFDYCVVQETLRSLGLEPVVSRLSNTFLEDSEAIDLAEDLLHELGSTDVQVVVLERLEGRIGGIFDPSTRVIYLDRPIRAWTVFHEVAHSVSSGHGDDFRSTLADLARRAGPTP